MADAKNVTIAEFAQAVDQAHADVESAQVDCDKAEAACKAAQAKLERAREKLARAKNTVFVAVFKLAVVSARRAGDTEAVAALKRGLEFLKPHEQH